MVMAAALAFGGEWTLLSYSMSCFRLWRKVLTLLLGTHWELWAHRDPKGTNSMDRC